MSPIEFGNPSGWWWAALCLPLIAFYFLKVRVRRQPVSTFLFWDKVFEEKKPRAWWQQLRHLWSLLLQLVLLALLVGGLVDPLWTWQKNKGTKLVLVIDNSASMGASEGVETRLALARRTATAVIRSLRAGDELALVASGGRPTVMSGFTEHVGSLITALNRIEQTDAPNCLAEAMILANRLLPPAESSRILLFTDGCDPNIAEIQQDPKVSLYGFGTEQENVSITEFQVRRSFLDATGYQVLVEISNLGKQAQKCRLELSLEGQLVDVVPIELDAGASKTLNLDQVSASGGRLVARLDLEDGLSADNRALAILPARQKMPVTLVTRGSVFLHSVLESISLVELETAAMVPNEASLRPDSLLVLHQSTPGVLPPGKLLVIDPRNDCDLWTVGERLETPLVNFVDDASPVTQHVRLANVLFPGAHELQFRGESQALIQTPLGEPLLTFIRRPGADVLLLNADLDVGDLPLRIAFPVLIKNAIEWFQGVRGELQPALTTGRTVKIGLSHATESLASRKPSSNETSDKSNSAMEVLSREANESVPREYVLRSPTGALTPLARDAATATLTGLNHCGLWTIATKDNLLNDPWLQTDPAAPRDREPIVTGDASAVDDSSRIHLACNLCNREESDLKPHVPIEPEREFAMVSVGGRALWFYLVIAATLLLVIEWWLYQRRVVG